MPNNHHPGDGVRDLAKKVEDTLQSVAANDKDLAIFKEKASALDALAKEHQKVIDALKEAAAKSAADAAEVRSTVRLIWGAIGSVTAILLLGGVYNVFLGPSARQDDNIARQKADLEATTKAVQQLGQKSSDIQNQLVKTATVAEVTQKELEKSSNQLRESLEAAKALSLAVNGLKELFQKELDSFNSGEQAPWAYLLVVTKSALDWVPKSTIYVVTAENLSDHTRAFLILVHSEDKQSDILEKIRKIREKFPNTLIHSLKMDGKNQKPPSYVLKESFVMKVAPTNLLKTLADELKSIPGMGVNENFIEPQYAGTRRTTFSRTGDDSILNDLSILEDVYQRPWEYTAVSSSKVSHQEFSW